MKINDMFPSKYLKCADLQGRSVKVTIDRIEVETLGENRKPVIYFRGKEKGLVANRTNCNTIADMYGDDTNGWAGKEITIYPTRVDFKGERVDSIRVQFLQPLPTVPAAASKHQHDERNPPIARSPSVEMNDEIPFAPEWRG